jgi:2-C-methyl-D-erythritol 4-phosphate cytidylyltransferase
MEIAAIIPAAGSGSRMSGANEPKQYLDLGGRTILEMTIGAISGSDLVDAIYPVLPSEDIEELSERLLKRFPKIKELVAGGAERAESVRNGIEAAKSGLVMIHDAARPFVSPCLIQGIIEAGSKHGAATAALPVSDTLKEMNGEFIGRPVDREKMLIIQTPQVFKRQMLIDIYEKISSFKKEWTDESSMVLEAGHPVAWVTGDPANIKITTEADYDLSRRILGLK